MHIALIDRIFCPRCGPEFGLILLAREVRDRRVLHGDLGCSQCRETYPVRSGVADLRPPPRGSLPDPVLLGESAQLDPEEPFRIGALLGVTEGPGTLLLEGPASPHAEALAKLVGGVEVVTIDPTNHGLEGSRGVSRIMASERLPFFTATFRGILLSGGSPDRLLEEAARVLAPRCRLVILGPPSVSQEEVSALGLRVLLREEEALVAEKGRSGSLPLLTLRGV